MVPRSLNTGAKLPSHSADRYLVARDNKEWTHIRSSDLQSLVKENSELAIWEDKSDRRHGKNGKIDAREITRISGGSEALLGDIGEISHQLDQAELGHEITLKGPASRGTDTYNDIVSEIGNGGYNAQHYTVRVEPDFEKKTIFGHTTMKAKADQKLESFSLDFMPFPASFAVVNGKLAETRQKDNEFEIIPQTPIKEGEGFQVDVLYEGAPHEVKEEYSHNLPFGMRFVDGALSTVSEPRAARGWFPSNDHPSDKATFDIEVTVPQGYEANASGTVESIETQENGDKTYRFEPKDEMATYLIGLNAFKENEFEVWQQESGRGVPIENSVPADTKPMARDLSLIHI